MLNSHYKGTYLSALTVTHFYADSDTDPVSMGKYGYERLRMPVPAGMGSNGPITAKPDRGDWP